MANTTQVTLSSSAWTLVSSGAASGLASLLGRESCLFVESNSLPDATQGWGHKLTYQQPDINFNLSAGQNLYARALGSGTTSLAVTEDS